MKISEIIETVKENKIVNYDDLKYALLSIDALWQFDSRTIQDLATRYKDSKIYTSEFAWKESFRRNKTALNQDPKTFVGWNNDPANPEYQKRRKTAIKIIDKIIEKTNKDTSTNKDY